MVKCEPGRSSHINPNYLIFNMETNMHHGLKWIMFAFTCVLRSEAQECSKMFYTQHGVITSPLYPEDYTNNMDCSYIIRQPRGYRITLSFIDFELEVEETCDYDYVQIFDGESSYSSELIKRLCNVTLPLDLRTSRNVMRIHFKSDNSRTFRGFNASYTSECGGTFTESYGVNQIHLNTSEVNLDCMYFVKQKPEYQIELLSFVFIMRKNDSCDNSVEIFDGESLSSPLLEKMFCNMTDRLTLRTTQNIMLIRFQAGGSNVLHGFTATYKVDCRGVFTERQREIKSPYYPNTYDLSSQCSYLIILPPGYVIQLSFLDLKIVQTSSYSQSRSFVEVRDGNSVSSPLIGNLRNNKDPLVFTSSHNSLLIVPRGESYYIRVRFLAQYKAECGGRFTARKGIITSYRDNYGNTVGCHYVISQTEGIRIRISFFEFQQVLQASSNVCYIQIHDGGSLTSPLLGNWFGNDTLPLVLTTSQNLMLIHVTANSCRFNVSYKTAESRRTFTAPEGEIVSPFYPDNYSDDTDCEYIIRQPLGYRIRIKFSDFNLGVQESCPFDFLEIYDGDNVTSPLLGNGFCNDSLPPVLTSSQNVMLIHCKTDNSDTQRRFKAAYKTARNCYKRNVITVRLRFEIVTVCEGTYTARKGVISFPFYPDMHVFNLTCVYKIILSTTFRIRLTFVDFDLGTSESCGSAVVEIFDGDTYSSPLLSKLSCNTTLPPVLTSTQRAMLIHFQRDVSGKFKGINASYTTSECGKNFTDANGVITSPFYPDNYENNMECIYIIRRPVGSQITLAILDFNLGEQSTCSDFVEIRDGVTLTSQLLATLHCNASLPSVLRTTSNMLVHFWSDGFLKYKGFNAFYNSTVCGGTFTADQGEIISPFYPDNYENNMDCVYIIRQPTGIKITLSFLDFQLEESDSCQYDFVEVRDGMLLDSPLLGERLCKVSLPLVLRSKTNYMLIHFKTDYSQSSRGFKSSYKAEFRFPKPIIHGYKENELLETGRKLTMKCSLKKSEFVVDAVLFSCQDHQDNPDIDNETEITSVLTINSITARDNGSVCVCIVVWKRKDIENHNITVTLNVDVKHQSYLKSPLISGLLGASVVVAVIIVMIFVVVAVKGHYARMHSSTSVQRTNQLELNVLSTATTHATSTDTISTSNDSIYFEINDLFLESQDTLQHMSNAEGTMLHPTPPEESTKLSTTPVSKIEQDVASLSPPVRSSNAGYLHPILNIIPLKAKPNDSESDSDSDYGDYLQTMTERSDNTNALAEHPNGKDCPPAPILFSVAW